MNIGQINEEISSKPAFAHEFRGSRSIEFAVATTKTGVVFSCIQVIEAPKFRASEPEFAHAGKSLSSISSSHRTTGESDSRL